ncbi:MAG TPA: hypothetical protein PKC76_02950 [Saprospiraceae bacterium]|nr:hypothetical protein [Saprospiraceae bacterium]HMP23060.1 hypothetical protein [Saprospiraceae bacterium]
METPPSSQPDKKPSPFINWFFQLYAYFKGLTKPGEADPTWLLVLKVIGQLGLLLLMILLSPVLLIGLLIAFIAVF